MDWLIYMGFGLVAVAVILATIWLKQGSKDKTATKDDINALGKKIETALDNLANEIKLERLNQNGEEKGNKQNE